MYTTIVLVIWHPHQTSKQILPHPDFSGSGGIPEKVLLGHHSNSCYLLKFTQLWGTHECACAFLGERTDISVRLKPPYVQTFET